MSGITDWYHDFAKANPKAAEVVPVVGGSAMLLGAGTLLIGMGKRLLGFGGRGAGAAAAETGAAGGGLGALAGLGAIGAAIAAAVQLPGRIEKNGWLGDTVSLV